MAEPHTTDPDYDRRQGDPVYHEQPPADSGSRSSFASRHNEFPPGAGHESAAHDRKTGAPVHGDGTTNEALPAQWQQDGASGSDPASDDTQRGEVERPDTAAGEGQTHEAHPEHVERPRAEP